MTLNRLLHLNNWVWEKNESWPNQNNRAKINDYPLWVSFGHVPTLQTQRWSQTVTSSLPKTVLPFIHSKAQDSPDDNTKSSSKSSFHYGLGDFYYLNWFDRFLAGIVAQIHWFSDTVITEERIRTGRKQVKQADFKHVDIEDKHHMCECENKGFKL